MVYIYCKCAVMLCVHAKYLRPSNYIRRSLPRLRRADALCDCILLARRLIFGHEKIMRKQYLAFNHVIAAIYGLSAFLRFLEQ